MKLASLPTLAVAATLALAVGCSGQVAPARPQWLVYVATDAQVPQVGQELLLELIDDMGNLVSPDSRRLVDGSRSELWPISFGIQPGPTGAPPRLRARFYRLDETGPGGLPQGNALIDATGVLPALGDGITQTAIVLSISCFGVAADIAGRRSCDPSSGALAPEPTLPAGVDPSSLLTVSAPVPCSGQLPQGMVCAPGGTFVLGSAHFSAPLFPASADPVPEHLVQLSPFAIDVNEVSIGQIRPLVQQGMLTAPGTGDPGGIMPPECTFLSETDPSHDSYPVNCVSWAVAETACRLFGKRLPSEAEWEYAAGGLGSKPPFPWGGDTDICHYAVVASGRGYPVADEPTECLFPPTPPGPHLLDGMSLDVVTTGGDGFAGQIQNMAGNVSEWVADVFDSYAGPCWQQGPVLVDPVCTSSVAKSSTIHAQRGGSWQLYAISAYVYARGLPTSDRGQVSTGFRCAMSM